MSKYLYYIVNIIGFYGVKRERKLVILQLK